MPHDLFAAAVHGAHEWLRAVAVGLETDGLAIAHRALRAWSHVVRDRIGMANSAHLAARLPELPRGVYYEGWVPSHVPVHRGLGEFVEQFARAAGIRKDEVGRVAGAITAMPSDRFSPGQLNLVFAVLPAHLSGILCGGGMDASLPIDTGDANRMGSAAQEAHRMLLAEGLVPGVRQH